jgi:PhoH-like ATPase
MTPLGKQVYVLDTSVLLADPKSMTRFEEHDVVLPVVVFSNSNRNEITPSWVGQLAKHCVNLNTGASNTDLLQPPLP